MSEVPSVFLCFRDFVTLFCHTSEFYPEHPPGRARQNPRSAFFLVSTIAMSTKQQILVKVRFKSSVPHIAFILDAKFKEINKDFKYPDVENTNKYSSLLGIMYVHKCDFKCILFMRYKSKL